MSKVGREEIENPIVVGYVRVSTEEQATEGYSIDAQADKIRKMCDIKGWDVPKIFADEGFSGRGIEKRPQYNEMMNNIKDWDILIVWKQDRIHRNMLNFAQMMDQINKKDKQFISIMENFDTTTSTGRFALDMLARIAQLESEQIGERVLQGMIQKAMEGGFNGARAPYGYKVVDNNLAKVPEEEEYVQYIFKLYSENKSAGLVADIMNDDEIPTRSGKPWSKMAICRIIKNPKYCGYLLWDSILAIGSHEPYITLLEWNENQSHIARHRKVGTKKFLVLENSSFKVLEIEASETDTE